MALVVLRALMVGATAGTVVSFFLVAATVVLAKVRERVQRHVSRHDAAHQSRGYFG